MAKHVVVGEVIGYEVKFLPYREEEIKSPKTGKVVGTSSKYQTIRSFVHLRVLDGERQVDIEVNTDQYSEGEPSREDNWESTKNMRLKTFKRLVKELPMGSEVELERKTGRGDRPYYIFPEK
jgi:hypothetical protein